MRRKNMSALKLCVGFVLFIMAMSVFSGAVSATDRDTNSADLAINGSSIVQSGKFNEPDYFKALSSTKTDNSVSILSYGYGSLNLKNQTKKVHVAISNSSDLGKFTMGGYYNGQWQTLLYGYPNYGYSTSYLTVRVENETASVDYTNTEMDEYVVEHVHWTGDDAVSMKWRLPDDIVIEQNIRLVQDYARIEIDATNEGSSAKKIGMRYYYDTKVADSDNAPIYVPGEAVKTTQEVYINPTFTYWKGYDDPTEPTVVSEAKISGADATTPDKLQIDNYGSEEAWENDITPGSTFSDSAVITYWNPTDVAPGQSKQVVTYYGIGAPVARGPFNISEIMVDRHDGNYCPGENVTIKVDVISIGKTHEGSVKIEVLDDGNVLYSSLPKSTGVVPADDVTTIQFNYSVGVDACNKRVNIKASLLNSSTLSLIDEMTKSALIIVDQSCPECAIKPDLVISEITWLPDGICDGDQVAVNATIVNNGTDKAIDFYVRFEIDGEYIGRKLIADLPAGSNTIITQNWLACAGSHNVTVYVDKYDAIEESDDTNNKMSKDLPFIPFPDLTVTNISLTPTDIVGGDTVTFTATIANVGAGSTSSEFYVCFEVDGKQIGKTKVANGLDSGNSTDVTQTWTATWANTVNVSVDEYDAVVEPDETNNRMSKDLPGLPYPDLVVTYLAWETIQNINAGDQVTFSATIENTGSTCYSSMNNPLKVALVVNGEHVGTRNIVGSILSGHSINTTFTWTAQPGTNPQVCVNADYSNIIPESNENDNELCKTPSFDIKSPDLMVTQITFEPTTDIHVGDVVEFRAKVENMGEGNYSGDFDIGFYVNDIYKGVSHVASGLFAGENTFVTFNWTASSYSNPVVKAKVDFFDVVQESDETNNEKTEAWSASIPFADLEITDITWQPEENIKDRDLIIFNVTVKNNGPENVVTNFNVYFDIDGYFTRTNLISGGLAADESRTTSFTWKATPGNGHNATVKVDPDNIVSESDETNNEFIQLLPFNVSLVEIFEVRVEPAEITTGIGGHMSCRLKINNYGSASSNFDLTVAGLDQSWYILSESSIFLSAGEEGIIDLAISVPEECENSDTFMFRVSVTSQETGITKEGSATLIVEPTPVIYDLLPQDRASLGSDGITFSWNTYINATTTLYLKAEDEVDYTSYTGAVGQIHTVVVSNLARKKNYSYYAESMSSCGSSTSPVRTFYIGNGVSFTKDVYEFTVERDYDRQVTIRVQNTDNEYHELLVEVPITYEDLVLGFVGDGSQDNIIPLNPGESKDVTLAIQCADALEADYELIANLTSTKGDKILTDTARIKLHVHVPCIDYDLEEIGVDPVTLTKTFKLTNKGDPITDLTISVADSLKENVYIEPVIDHFRLDVGASIEFDVVPLLSSHDFHPASDNPPVGGNIIVPLLSSHDFHPASDNPPVGGNIIINPGHRTKKIVFSVPVHKNVYTVIIHNVTVITHIETWFCNNRPYVTIWWETVDGITKEEIIEDPLIIKFTSTATVQPHDVYISINGHEIGSLINTVPDGYYKFEVDPSFLNYPERGVARNSIEINTVHQNGGHYVVGSDMEVRLHLKNYTTHVVASSQEEANQIAEDNLPPGFYKAPDSISIESSGTEVSLGNPVPLEATSSPNLMVWATFDNGDGAVYFHEAESGVYRGTWTPQHPGDSDTGACVITIHAKAAGVKGEMTRTVTIINPTKLKVEILEPPESFDVSVGDAVVVSARVTRTDDQGRDYGYGSPGSHHLMITPYFSNGDGWITLSASGGGVYTGIWVPKNEGDCTIEILAQDYAGKLTCSSASVSGTVSAGDFSISCPGSLNMMVHDYVKTQIRVVSIKGFKSPVTLSSSWISPAPTGVTISFDPSPVTPPADGSISSTLNITTTRDAIPGTYQLKVTGTSGSLTNSTQITLTINPRPLVPDLDTVLDIYHPGNRVIIRGNVSDDINRNVPKVIVGIQLIDPYDNYVGEKRITTTDDIGHCNMIFTLPDDAPTGTWTVSITASRKPGYIDGTQQVNFNVADFALWGDDLTMSVGTAGESIITIDSINGFNSKINLAIANLGALPIEGYFFNPNPVIPPRSTLTVNVPVTANRGTYEVIITGVIDDVLGQPPLIRTTTITLTIVPGISGDVLEVGLFDPIPGAVVTAERIEGTSERFSTNAPNSGINPDDGTYWLMVPPGVYRVWATAPGYITSTGYDGDRVIVEAGKETGGIDFRLVTTFTKIHGNVADANTGLPIGDALIDVLGPRYPLATEPYENVRIKTRTDADGNYNITLQYTVQPSGIYNVTASAVGFRGQSKNAIVNWSKIIADYTWIPVNFTLVPAQPIRDVNALDAAVIIDYARTAVTDDPVGEGYDVANAPANVDLATAKGFTIAATGPDGAYLFDITFPTPVNADSVLYKLPAWIEIPYALTGANTVQVQLAINGGILDPAFILASGAAEVYLTIEDDTCLGYEVYVDGVYQFTEGEDGTPDGYCAFYVPEGAHTIALRKNGYSTSATINFVRGSTYHLDSMPDYWCGESCEVYLTIEDDTCLGYEVYVDGVYQFTEGEDGTPDGYCAFHVPEGAHTIALRKNGYSTSATINFLCGYTYHWDDMPDYWCGESCEAYLTIEDDTCLGYEVYVDGVYQFTEGEDGTPDGYCAFYVPEGAHTIALRKNSYSTSATINFLCGYTYHWDDMLDYWCGESCEVYLTIEDDTCFGYEVYVDGVYQFTQFTEGEDGTPYGYCAFYVPEGAHTIELRKNSYSTSVTNNFLCGYTYHWDDMPDYWCWGG